MNTFWAKMAGFAVVVVALIILVKFLSPSETEPKPEPKTFQDVAEQDKREFLTEPKSEESAERKPQLAEKQAPADKNMAEPIKIYCRELSEIDKIEAERLLNVAVPGRSIGRLPMTGFKLMVDNCRRIIQRWPDSWYAFRAKQMLAEMPQRFHKRYRVTEEELDLSRFAKPRPGTKPFTVEGPD